MDGFHVQSVAQDKGDLMFGAKISDPVPGEHALGANSQIFKKGKDYIEQQFRIGLDIFVDPGFALLVDDAHVHFPCMQIDAAIEFVSLIVKSHGLPPSFVK
jgi:hypothetical protein